MKKLNQEQVLTKLKSKKFKITHSNLPAVLCWIEGKGSQVKVGDMREVLSKLEWLDAVMLEFRKNSPISLIRNGAKKKRTTVRKLMKAKGFK